MEILDTPIDSRSRNVYPWDEWIKNGQTIRLREGEDFPIARESMRAMLGQQARLRGLHTATKFGRDARSAFIDATFTG